MRACRYEIRSRDFDQAGAATGDLKARLKRVGVEPAALRRAVIAAYEAAMNVVIHAQEGVMRVEIGPGVLRIAVQDKGPGIGDVDQAMAPGYSTAPDFARHMGFGAGLGLPNMKRHSDRFAIRSQKGSGTCVEMEVRFQAPLAAGADRHSIRLEPAKCRNCLACVRGCPTAALRVWKNGPEILDHLCVDCGRCIVLCPEGAIAAETTEQPTGRKGFRPLLVPPALFGQFGAGVGAQRILGALGTLGYAPVHSADPWRKAVREASFRHASQDVPLPVISPECPAVINLIELRYPSLIPHVAPLADPIEAAAAELGRDVAAVASCPAECTALARMEGREEAATVSLAALVQAMRPLLAESQDRPQESTGKDSFRQPPREAEETLEVRGMTHCMAALDEIENGLLADVPTVALYACDGGCFGAPLAEEEPAVAEYRWQRMAAAEPMLARTGPLGEAGKEAREQPPARVVSRSAPLAPREGVRLHRDMAKAIALLGEIDRMTSELPGRDCSLCGAPTCAAFAEDVALGRMPLSACAFRSANEEKP